MEKIVFECFDDRIVKMVLGKVYVEEKGPGKRGIP